MLEVEQRERRVSAYVSALITRGQDIDLAVAIETDRAKYDEMLISEPMAPPVGVDADEAELRRILGVG